MSSLGLDVMTKIDRQDNSAHLHRHIHTYTLNIHAEMYTDNYREVYQSAGISACLNACEQVIPSLPTRLYREGTRITPRLLSLYLFFFLLMPLSHPLSLLYSLLPVSHLCVCVYTSSLCAALNDVYILRCLTLGLLNFAKGCYTHYYCWADAEPSLFQFGPVQGKR